MVFKLTVWLSSHHVCLHIAHGWQCTDDWFVSVSLRVLTLSGRSKSGRKVPMWTWIVVGVVGLALLAAVVIIVVLLVVKSGSSARTKLDRCTCCVAYRPFSQRLPSPLGRRAGITVWDVLSPLETSFSHDNLSITTYFKDPRHIQTRALHGTAPHATPLNSVG